LVYLLSKSEKKTLKNQRKFSIIPLLAGDVVDLAHPKVIAFDIVSSDSLDTDGSPTPFPDLSREVLPESMQMHWINSWNNLINPAQVHFTKVRGWNERQLGKIEGEDGISQKELDTAAYVFTIAELANSYMPRERVKFIEWIYLSAAYSLDTNAEFFASEVGQSFIDSLKHFMFPLDEEDVETFQLRMNLLQYIRHNVSIERSEDTDNIYEKLGGWIKSQSVLQSLAESDRLKVSLGVDVINGGFDIYRLKASEGGANATDAFALTFETTDLATIQNQLNVSMNMKEVKSGVLVSDIQELGLRINVDENNININSAQLVKMRLDHGKVAVGGV